MSTTITIRADDALRRALEKRAAANGQSLSELIREILQAAVSERPLAARIGHLKGKLTLPREKSSSWRDDLRRQNWRT